VSLIPAGRRGGGLALVGVVTGAASVAALPLGVWLAGQAGFRPVFLIAALAALAPVVTMPWLPPGGQAGGLPSGQASTRRSTGIVAGLRTPALIRPAMMFFATTMATGIFVTFLPLTATRATADTAALALLIQPLASIGGRCLAGWAGDRRGAASPGEPASTLLVPGMLLTAAGLALLSLTAVPAAVLAGAALFGAGFGIAQNTTLTLMYDRVPQEAYSMVSALWNLAYDTGMGVGAAGFGVLAAGTGYPAAFLLTASVVVLAVGLNRRTKEH
jgi:predicted MFS family arabinose efflux permease